MAGIFWVIGVLLLVQGSLCSMAQTDKGCMTWTSNGDNVCCDACHPGHRLVMSCGQNPKELCTLCGPEMFAKNPKEYRCHRCTQCIGVQAVVEKCTPYTDTKCGCKAGLTCGDDKCSFCVKTCDKGQEPEKRSCRPCPPGTFNDKKHQMCKPWSTRCPHPDQVIVAEGSALSDIKCANVSLPVRSPNKPDINGSEWHSVLTAVTSALLMTCGIIIVIIVIVTRKVLQKKNEKEDNEEEEEEEKTPITKTPIIRTPTDEPKTLIAIECSFHEAQQEQGGSSESIASKDSSDRLIA